MNMIAVNRQARLSIRLSAPTSEQKELLEYLLHSFLNIIIMKLQDAIVV